MAERSIGIIGVGMVGNAVREYYLKQPGTAVFCFDKNDEMDGFEKAAAADTVFLCLPTPTNEDGSQDQAPFAEILPKMPTGKTVVVKSTLLPGSTAKFAKQRPDLFILHNPEFLDARTAVRDFAEPDVQVVGYTENSKAKAESIMMLLPKAPHQAICKSDESEMVKYMMNLFMATKNSFANQIYDYCKAKGIDYDRVKNIVKLAPRMGGEVHLRVFDDGYRGFSGACLPKDLKALLGDASSLGQKLELLAIVKKLNDEYLSGSNKANH